ncbi:hypothetical protein L1987_61894 [Smallanthus sonchifolius]|uniref:Uncharacterized protein n=1 Tax=Smallanthus sonchifolius TaxID=185202 RepID=A0ACB9C8Z4_9ASTR|nr:hypothetical protein L1987_61894 [Smallanthus sonchifolius]
MAEIVSLGVGWLVLAVVVVRLEPQWRVTMLKWGTKKSGSLQTIFPALIIAIDTSRSRSEVTVYASSTFAFWSTSSVNIEPRRTRLQSNNYTTNTLLDVVIAATIQAKSNPAPKNLVKAKVRYRSYHTISMESSPSRSNSPILFMLALTSIRTQMTNKNQSAFEINGNEVFLIIAIVALIVVEVTSGILFCTNIIRDNILNFIVIFSAMVAPFSLSTVVAKDSSMWCLVGIVICAIAVALFACIYSSNDKTSSIYIFTCLLGLVLVPLALVLMLFVPKNFNWIVYSVIYASCGMEVICLCITFFKIFMGITNYQDNQNLEGIQHT